MTAAIDFARSLAGESDVIPHFADVDRMAAAGDWQLLLAIALALEDLGDGLDVPPWKLEMVFDQILRALALTPAPGNARAVLGILGIERRHTRQESRPPFSAAVAARDTAAFLAHGQSPETCFELCTETPDDVATEALACWIQELVVRGVEVDRRAEVVELWSTLRALEHPLSDLPLARMEAEVSLPQVLPVLGLRGSSAALPFGPLRDDAGPLLGVAVSVRELEPTAAAAAVVLNWVQESIGKFEVCLLDVEGLPSRLQPGVLAQLPLDCLAGASAIRCRDITANECAAILFAAAASGGAHNSGRRAAYGRLDLWTSLAALSGVELPSSVADVEQVASACSFHQFSAASAWFHRVAWDLGIACLRPDRRTLSILAATDTD